MAGMSFKGDLHGLYGLGRVNPAMYGGIWGVNPPHVRRRYWGVNPPQHTAWGGLTPSTIHYGGIGGFTPLRAFVLQNISFAV